MARKDAEDEEHVDMLYQCYPMLLYPFILIFLA